jgi:myo-inositol 2-dehydrogenase/D-chiro-inositol 1-dehydrogenase
MVAHHAVAAGKHVFVEKPLALSLDECERLIQAASGSSVVAMVGFNMRFHRLLREARQVIRSGGLGELLAVRTLISSRSRFDGVSPTWTTSLANGGAALTEQAIHHFDLWRFLLEREVAEVFAFARGGATPHKTAAVTARFGDDILATALFSEESSNANEVEIYGRQGRLRVSTFRVDGLELQRSREAAGDLRTRLGSAARSLRALPRGVRQLQRGGEFMATYHAEWLHFHGAVQHGTPIESTLADGRAALAIALAAVASATSGSPVRPSDAPRDIESAGMTGPRAPD